jgi:hypothetical protein
VLGMLETDDFIRCVLLTKDRLPSIILYTERQLHELKTFCFSKSYVSVLTFDKTYNLRSVFVTAAVYKHRSDTASNERQSAVSGACVYSRTTRLSNLLSVLQQFVRSFVVM